MRLAAGTPLEEAVGDLSFDATVPRTLVHKRAVEEVLLTDSIGIDRDRFLCAGQLPRAHRLYGAGTAGRYDLLLLAELVRQATVLVGHEHLGVPDDRQFMLTELDLVIVDPDALAVGTAPAEATIEILARDRRELDGALAGYRLDGSVYVDRVPAASGSGSCMCLAPDDYRAVREAGPRGTGGAPAGPHPGEAADAARVGRADPRDVVVAALEWPSPGTARSSVVVDGAHPSFFDHPLDHVPGMLLLEAARQTAVAAVSAALGTLAHRLAATGCRARFLRFAELGAAVRCEASVPGLRAGSRNEPIEVVLALKQRSSRLADVSLQLSDEPHG